MWPNCRINLRPKQPNCHAVITMAASIQGSEVIQHLLLESEPLPEPRWSSELVSSPIAPSYGIGVLWSPINCLSVTRSLRKLVPHWFPWLQPCQKSYCCNRREALRINWINTAASCLWLIIDKHICIVCCTMLGIRKHVFVLSLEKSLLAASIFSVPCLSLDDVYLPIAFVSEHRISVYQKDQKHCCDFLLLMNYPPTQCRPQHLYGSLVKICLPFAESISCPSSRKGRDKCLISRRVEWV